MRTFTKPVAMILLLATACTAFGAGGGSLPTPTDQKFATRSPESQAQSAYNTGVKLIEKGFVHR
jgi:hypothetical protein